MTIKSAAICLGIRPWSRTSHVVSWLTPEGRLATVIKGAERPKSFFLGQYDLNYRCEIVYYARARNELHALRECVPIDLRESLRGDYRALALADYFRGLVSAYAPSGAEAGEWFKLLDSSLSKLSGPMASEDRLRLLIAFELEILHLMGLSPEVEAESGGLVLKGERRIPVSTEVAKYLASPLEKPFSPQVPLDAARVIGVFYTYHLDPPAEVRRTVLKMILNNNERDGQNK